LEVYDTIMHFVKPNFPGVRPRRID
jgi:hypothetical protein